MVPCARLPRSVSGARAPQAPLIWYFGTVALSLEARGGAALAVLINLLVAHHESHARDALLRCCHLACFGTAIPLMIRRSRSDAALAVFN